MSRKAERNETPGFRECVLLAWSPCWDQAPMETARHAFVKRRSVSPFWGTQPLYAVASYEWTHTPCVSFLCSNSWLFSFKTNLSTSSRLLISRYEQYPIKKTWGRHWDFLAIKIIVATWIFPNILWKPCQSRAKPMSSAHQHDKEYKIIRLPADRKIFQQSYFVSSYCRELWVGVERVWKSYMENTSSDWAKSTLRERKSIINVKIERVLINQNLRTGKALRNACRVWGGSPWRSVLLGKKKYGLSGGVAVTGKTRKDIWDFTEHGAWEGTAPSPCSPHGLLRAGKETVFLDSELCKPLQLSNPPIKRRYVRSLHL